MIEEGLVYGVGAPSMSPSLVGRLSTAPRPMTCARGTTRWTHTHVLLTKPDRAEPLYLYVAPSLCCILSYRAVPLKIVSHPENAIFPHITWGPSLFPSKIDDATLSSCVVHLTDRFLSPVWIFFPLPLFSSLYFSCVVRDHWTIRAVRVAEKRMMMWIFFPPLFGWIFSRPWRSVYRWTRADRQIYIYKRSSSTTSSLRKLDDDDDDFSLDEKGHFVHHSTMWFWIVRLRGRN